MAWWQWIVLGSVLLGAELLVDAEFYLVFLGLAAILMGLIGLGVADIPMWSQWLLFALISAASLVFFRARLYALMRPEAQGYAEGVGGASAIACESIAVGDVGRVELRGTPWNARNVGDLDIPEGARVLVVRTESLQLDVRLDR